jgi:hypothetical protein
MKSLQGNSACNIRSNDRTSVIYALMSIVAKNIIKGNGFCKGFRLAGDVAGIDGEIANRFDVDVTRCKAKLLFEFIEVAK